MARFTLRPTAQIDLELIWRYTLDQWGEQQADTYIRQLNEGFHLLAREPETGRDCGYIRPGYRKYHTGRHIIFYRPVSDSEIEVVRVLHERMDVNQHLSE